MNESERALLAATPLFAGIDPEALEELLTCLAPVRRRFGAGEVLLAAGSAGGQVGVVLAGSIEAYRPTPGGSRVLITRMGPGGVFGDVLAGSSLQSPVTVQAAGPCTALFFSYQRILGQAGPLCDAHAQLLLNLVRAISDKYFLLARRVELLTVKSLRARIAGYLLEESARAGAETFCVPFTRARLAEYLNCDRSALCRELGRMQAEGVLETYKSSFKLKDPAALRAAAER